MRRILASLLVVPALSAHADVITLDADELAPGTSITAAIEGVTILSYYDRWSPGHSTYTPVISEVVVSDCPDQRFCNQDQVFAGGAVGMAGATNWGFASDAYRCEQGDRYACLDTSSHVMNFHFDRSTNHFSFESYWLSDAPALFAFDAGGSLLFSCFQASECFNTTTSDGTEHISLMGFQRTEADVSRVMIGFNQGVGRIQEVSVSVPEPGTWLLFATGLAAALVFRRHRTAVA